MLNFKIIIILNVIATICAEHHYIIKCRYYDEVSNVLSTADYVKTHVTFDTIATKIPGDRSLFGTPTYNYICDSDVDIYEQEPFGTNWMIVDGSVNPVTLNFDRKYLSDHGFEGKPDLIRFYNNDIYLEFVTNKILNFGVISSKTDRLLVSRVRECVRQFKRINLISRVIEYKINGNQAQFRVSKNWVDVKKRKHFIEASDKDFLIDRLQEVSAKMRDSCNQAEHNLLKTHVEATEAKTLVNSVIKSLPLGGIESVLSAVKSVNDFWGELDKFLTDKASYKDPSLENQMSNIMRYLNQEVVLNLQRRIKILIDALRSVETV